MTSVRLVGLIVCCGLVTISLKSTSAAAETFPGKESIWSGYVRYDFDQNGRAATVVVPKQPAEGKPWLWRGEFFGAFPSVDLALLDKGYHVVYLNCANTYGSPETMERWEGLYDLLVKEHGFSKKPVLLGMSRGGLYVYSWAARHPDRVGAIYGDAPVCDIKSWPGGKFTAKGSPGDWQNFLKLFHLTEAQAMDWKGNPIDVLEPIAKAKIPIIHVCGAVDEVVPMAENTDVLKQRYEALGGSFVLISKPGVGHHPHSLEDPTPVVQFLEKNRIRD